MNKLKLNLTKPISNMTNLSFPLTPIGHVISFKTPPPEAAIRNELTESLTELSTKMMSAFKRSFSGQSFKGLGSSNRTHICFAQKSWRVGFINPQ